MKLLVCLVVLGLIAACTQGEPTPSPEPESPTATSPSIQTAPTTAPELISDLIPTDTPAPTPTRLRIPSASFSVDVEAGSAPLTVQFSNTSTGTTSVEWDFGDGQSSTDKSPTHRYTAAGSHTVRLEVSGPGGSDTSSMADFVTVEPGPAVSLEVSPSTATVAVQETTQFTAVARDEFGNVVLVTPKWVAAEGGSIADDGLFSADTVAGSYADSVQASLQSASGGLEANASVTVEPGSMAEVTVEPAGIALNIGATQQFTFQALDKFGNQISDALSSWSVAAEAGSIDEDGVLTTGTKAGLFLSGIQVDVVKGVERVSAPIDIAILPGPLALIEVKPSFIVMNQGEQQQFNAKGYDQFGNEMPRVAFLWETEGGEITSKGFYTANELGQFDVIVSATFEGIERFGSAVADVPLVAWWTGDGTANDAVGGHHGALRGGATFGPGIVGQAFSLPQSGAHVEVLIGNNDFNFAPTQSMTIEMWVKRTYPAGPLPTGLVMHLVGKRLPVCHSSTHYQMPYFGNHIEFSFGSGHVTARKTDILPYDKWKHLVVTFDGFVYRFYVDGVLGGEPSFGTFQFPNNVSLVIGGSGGCSTLIGLIDEVKIYNRALSDEEVKAIYDAVR